MKKKVNGVYYQREKTCMGRVFWVRLTREEVTAQRLETLGMVIAPLVMVWLFAWSAGMI